MKRMLVLKLFWVVTLSCLFLLSACSGKEDMDTNSVIVHTVPVRYVAMNKISLVLKVDESDVLTATISPKDATNRNVFWTSSNASVATVKNGKVTAIKPGNVTITVKTEDGGKAAQCAVTVISNVVPVTIGSEHISAVSAVLKGEVGLDAQTASGMKIGMMCSENSDVPSSSSTRMEATHIEAKEGTTTSCCYSINLTGLVPAKTYYFRTYISQSGRDTYGQIKSFTTKNLSSMLETKDATEVSPTSAILNAVLDLTDVQYGSIERGFYWGASKDEQNTFLKALDDIGGELAGTQEYYEFEIDWNNEITKNSTEYPATLKAQRSSLDENSFRSRLGPLSHNTRYWYKAYLKVDDQKFYGEVKTFITDVVPVTEVSLNTTQYSFNTIGNTLTLTPIILPADATNKAVSWRSSNTSVATVDANGTVTAKGNGTAIITVTTNDQSKTATCEITVCQKVTGISLSKSSVTLNEGQTVTLTATISPSNAKDKSVTWSSDNTSVATVDPSGKVTAVSKGTATIKATANDGSGMSGFCSVTVNRLVTSIKLNKTSISIYNGKTETLTATVSPSTASNTGVNWTSSNTSIAKVSSSGVVTGVAKGTATITATAKDGSGKSASCSVEVKHYEYVTSVDLPKSKTASIIYAKGEYRYPTVSVTATVNPSNANNPDLTWTSSGGTIVGYEHYSDHPNDYICKVKFTTQGTYTVTATAKDGSGKTDSCKVTIKLTVVL